MSAEHERKKISSFPTTPPLPSILPRFYFDDVLEQLKTNFHTNFRFKRALGFVIEYAWISKLLGVTAFTWRPKTKISIRKEAEVKIHRNRVTTRYESTDGKLGTWVFLISDVIIVMAARWLPNNEEFFVGLVRLLEASETNLNSASYDNSEFLFRRLDAHQRTLSTLLTVLTSLHDSCSSRMNKF